MFLFLTLPVLAQYDRIDSLLLDVFGNDNMLDHVLYRPSKYSYIYSGISLDNKTYYAGRELGDDMFSANGNLFMFHRTGLYFGLSGSWYSDVDPAYYSTIVSAGFRKSLNAKKTITISAACSRLFMTRQDESIEISYKNNLGAGLFLQNRWLGGSISANLLFGNETLVTFTPAVFSNIKLLRFGTFGRIYFEPEVSAFVGSETVYKTLDAVNESFSTAEKYGLLNIKAYIPVSIYFSSFNLEAGYSFNIPRTQDNFIKYPVSSFFSVSLAYLLPLK